MSYPGPGAQPTALFVDGAPVSSLNPLPTTGGGGGGGTVDQGAANSDAAKGWSARLTDGAAFIVPAKTGQLPTTLGATTAAGSLAVGIATDQLSTLATAAKQDTGNSSLSSILGQLDAKTSTLATESTLNAVKTLQGGGLPAALVGGRLDVNTGAWLGSTAPTVGQKAMSASLPVVVASDQSTLPVVQPSATYSVIYTSTTTTVASSACTLYKIYWTAGVSSTMAAYDNGSGGTTNQFVSKLTSSDGEIDFGPLGVRLANGLMVVTTGGTPAFVTIVLRT